MPDSTNDMPPEQFVPLIKAGILSEAEIADWIRSNPTQVVNTQLLEAIVAFKGGHVDGIVRTALREASGLRPVPGDPT